MSRSAVRSSVVVAFLILQTFYRVGRAQPGNVKDCLPVLAKDYYSYAQKTNLVEDFLQSIDSESWDTFKQSNEAKATGIFSAGIFALSDDYKTFDEKRSKYLATMHYSRNHEQAINILSITTGPRAYQAYEACVQSLSAAVGPPLRIWAARESMDEIELHVKYLNPPNVRRMSMEGIVSGGSVSGAGPGHIWPRQKRWGINQEFTFLISRQRGAAETRVLVTPSDGSPSASAVFQRADGFLTLSFVGTHDVLRQRGRRTAMHTPNNNENRGGCPNEVGRADGKYCMSRTTVALTTAAPHFLQNAQGSCSGGGCPWSRQGAASISPDGLTATTYLDNWGSDVDAVLTADEYEHLTSAQCGSDEPIPVVKDRATVLTVPKECSAIATVKWMLLPAGSQGALRFGDKISADGSVAMDGPPIETDTAILASYAVRR